VKRLRIATLCLTLLPVSAIPVLGDTLTLNSGRTISGTILQTNSASVLVLTEDGAAGPKHRRTVRGHGAGILWVTVVLAPHSSGGSVYVRGYYRSNGTYVHSYTRRR
jgi:hypothetical protein